MFVTLRKPFVLTVYVLGLYNSERFKSKIRSILDRLPFSVKVKVIDLPSVLFFLLDLFNRRLTATVILKRETVRFVK